MLRILSERRDVNPPVFGRYRRTYVAPLAKKRISRVQPEVSVLETVEEEDFDYE